MLKSLFATCLTALSVNTQALAVPPSIEPSRAITQEPIFNVGDIYNFVYTLSFNSDNSLDLLSNNDSGTNSISFIAYKVTPSVTYSYVGYFPFDFDYCIITLGTLSNSVNLVEFDNDSDILADLGISNLDTNISYEISFTFEILDSFEGFSTEALPYLSKVEKPYTPPVKSNLYRLLYDFYYSIFNDDDLTAINTGYNMPFDNWLAHTCTIATLITLIFVAFFFLRWLFRVISGLVLLKR